MGIGMLRLLPGAARLRQAFPTPALGPSIAPRRCAWGSCCSERGKRGGEKSGDRHQPGRSNHENRPRSSPAIGCAVEHHVFRFPSPRITWASPRPENRLFDRLHDRDDGGAPGRGQETRVCAGLECLRGAGSRGSAAPMDVPAKRHQSATLPYGSFCEGG